MDHMVDGAQTSTACEAPRIGLAACRHSCRPSQPCTRRPTSRRLATSRLATAALREAARRKKKLVERDVIARVIGDLQADPG